MDLHVKQSGVKTSPQSDLREGNTSRCPTKKRKARNDTIRIGTWNVRTLLQAGKLENAKKEMERNKLDVLGMSEVRWRGSGEMESDDYRVYYSGEERTGKCGVGIIIGNRLKTKVINVEYFSGRIMMLKIKGQNRDLVILQIYMPTSQYPEEEVEQQYEKIEEIIEKENKKACIIIMGDWNAVVGEGSEDKVVGKFGLGTRNERGQRLIDFCKVNRFIVGNTVFETHKRRRYTWTSPFEAKRYQIDYILVQQRYRNSLKSARSYPGADICSDHNLVVAELCVKLKRVWKSKKKEELEVEKLKENSKAQEMETLFMEKLRKKEGEKKKVEEMWSDIRDSLKEAVKQTVGIKVSNKIRKNWISEEMVEKMDERRRWKNIYTEEGKKMYRKLNNELRRETEKAREKWIGEKCNIMEKLEKEGRYDLMYKEATDLMFKERGHKESYVIETVDGVKVEEPKEIIRIWEEYIMVLYGWADRPKVEELKVEEENKVIHENKGYSILKSEMDKAIEELKIGKAVGCDEIPTEVLKALRGNGKDTLLELYNRIYKEGIWPKDFIESIMVPIAKKKSARKCEEYRTLSLISHAAKILLRILNRRLNGKINRTIAEEQFGFRSGVGTRDAIGLLRVIGERHMEKNKKVYVVFVDLEKAFDRVRWDKLMMILNKNGVDWRERRLIKELYVNQTVRVRIKDLKSEEIELGRGVRQGCCLSPTLFNLYLEEILGESLDGKRGVKMGGRVIECIRFADDMALLSDNINNVAMMLEDLDRTCEKYGMRINRNKTKCMVIGDKNERMVIRLQQTEIDQVKQFKYLGSIITEDLRCTTEIKVRVAMAKEGFNRRKRLLCGPLKKDMRKRLIKCFVWSIALYGSETWTLRKEEERRLEALEMWMWRKMEKISWEDRISNEVVLRRIGEERQMLKTIRKRKMKWLGHWMRRECLLKVAIEGMVNGKRKRGRKRYQMLDSILRQESYGDTKRLAQNRDEWRAVM